jgi:PAS domain S-box-containing protein
MSVRSAFPFTDDVPRAPKGPRRAREAKQAGESSIDQPIAEREVDRLRCAVGPFVAATEAMRMAMVFTDALEVGNPIIFANERFLELTGHSLAEADGQSFELVMSRLVDPESLERIAAQFAAKAVESVEVKCHRRDERIRLLAVRIHPVHDRSGRVIRHCISCVDLSPPEERARDERAALQARYQHSADFIATMEGAKHRLTFANDAFQRLFGNQDLIGVEAAKAVPEFSEQGLLILLDEVYRTGQSFTGSNMTVWLRRGGQAHDVRFLDFTFQAVRDGVGTITGVFCEGNDATKQVETAAQERLVHAELNEASVASAMVTMAATIAHELNQPLTTISNYASVCNRLVGATCANGEGMTSAIKGIADGAKRAGEIIRRLRDMTEHRQLHHETFDMADAIRESLRLVRAGACGATPIEYRGGSKLNLEGDRVQIEQVILNLARNACEAVAEREGGRVVLFAAVRDSEVVVSVCDNGSGVSPEMAGSLFEWAHSSKRGGMGIGLSICRQIVEAHHGRIWLESTSDGGTCLAFSLPLDTAHP